MWEHTATWIDFNLVDDFEWATNVRLRLHLASLKFSKVASGERRLWGMLSANEASGSAQAPSEMIQPKPPYPSEAASGSLDDAAKVPKKEKKTKFPYLCDEDIFASFNSKRAYERE